MGHSERKDGGGRFYTYTHTIPKEALTNEGDMPFMYLGSNAGMRSEPGARVMMTNPTAVSYAALPRFHR